VDVAYDTTDNLLDPSRGIRFNGTVEPFAYLGNSGAGPVMTKGSVSTYHAFDEDNRYIIAGKVAAGSIAGANLFDIPPQRRFYVGGGGSLRGFDYQSASPRNARGDIIGGMSFFTASAEMRVKITDTIGIVPFLDMGSAFASEIPDFNGLRYSAGVGLRYYTALGPIRFDVAVPLNPRAGDSKYGIYVSLGQSF
jgi:translocation and assembly module TamA